MKRHCRTTVLLFFTVNCSLHGAWQAGAAAVDITLKESIWLAGYSDRTQPSQSVRQPIHTKALALKDDAGTVSVVITMDLVGVQRDLAEQVARRAASELRLPRERLIFNASHTHSAPVVGDFSMYSPIMGRYLEGQKEAIGRYAQELPKLIFDAIAKSIANLRPAALSFEQGYAGFAVNRRRVGHREYFGPVDQDVPVLAVKGADGRMIAILFGYACHNTVMNDSTVHGDYAGYAQLYLEQRFPGTVALFMQGGGADSNPLPRRKPEHLERYGATLADAVQEVVQRGMKPITGTVAATIEFPELAYEGPFDRSRWLEETKSAEVRQADHGRRMLDILDHGASIPQSRGYAVEAWQFGKGLTLIALAGEVMADYALKFKSQFGPDSTWIAGYSNDSCGYIPSLRVWKEGGYEGGESFRFTNFPGRWRSDIEDRISAAVERVVTKVRAQ